MHDIWDAMLSSVRVAIGDHAFDTWFSSIKNGGFSEHRLIIEVPDEFFEKWIKDFYTEQISAALKSQDPYAVFDIRINP